MNPRHYRAVVESKYQFEVHANLSLDTNDNPKQLGPPVPRNHAVDQHCRSTFGLKLSLQYQAPVPIAAANRAYSFRWRDRPMTVVGCSNQGRETSTGIEVRKAEPI